MNVERDKARLCHDPSIVKSSSKKRNEESKNKEAAGSGIGFWGI